MEQTVSDTILFVDAVELLDRLRDTRGRGGKSVLDRAESVSWERFPERMRDRPLQGVAVLNLTSPSALPIREAARLPRTHPGLRTLYVLDTQRPLPTGRALTGPGVDFISSRADTGELVSRVQRLLEPLPVIAPKSERPKSWPATTPRLMPEVHHPVSGRLDAHRLAQWLDLPLKAMTRVVEREYATVHKTPDAPALQEALRPYLRIASALNYQAGSRARARVWLNTPNPDLEGETPRALLEREADDVEVVADLLEDSLYGMPG